MSDLGQLLKKARREKGVSLEELQETTKIQKRYLEAIEEGNFNVLPGSFYVRAFIKSYSEAVGLDPGEVMHLYRSVIPDVSSEKQVEPVRNRRRKRSFNSDRLTKWLSTIMMWLFPVIIAASFYIFYKNYYERPEPVEPPPITSQLHEPDETNDDPNDIEEPSSVDEEPDFTEEPPAEPEVSFVVTESSTYIYNVSNAEQLKVEIIANGSCWIRVRQDNSTGLNIAEKTFAANDSEIWEVDHSLYVRLGNPSNVEVWVNDVLIDQDNMQDVNPWNLQLNFVNGSQSEDIENNEDELEGQTEA